MGEWVAWNVFHGIDDHKTAIKRFGDPSYVQPDYITYNGYFAQWTDDGNLLFCTGRGMAIVDRNGNELHKFSVPSGTVGGVASWRRYEHR